MHPHTAPQNYRFKAILSANYDQVSYAYFRNLNFTSLLFLNLPFFGWCSVKSLWKTFLSDIILFAASTWYAKHVHHGTWHITTLIARFKGPTWGPSGVDRTQVGPILAPWTLLSRHGQLKWSTTITRKIDTFRPQSVALWNTQINRKKYFRFTYLRMYELSKHKHTLSLWSYTNLPTPNQV